MLFVASRNPQAQLVGTDFLRLRIQELREARVPEIKSYRAAVRMSVLGSEHVLLTKNRTGNRRKARGLVAFRLPTVSLI
jgi:hypothetical protein